MVPPRAAEASVRRSHGTVSLPNGLLDRAQKLVEHFPELGYTNKSSFTEEALRRWLEREEERAAVMNDLYESSKERRRLELDFTKPKKR